MSRAAATLISLVILGIFALGLVAGNLNDALQVEVSLGPVGTAATGVGSNGPVKMQLIYPSNGLTRGGEAVITIQNYTREKQDFLLAQTNLKVNQLPPKLFHAITAQADPRIVDISGVLGPVVNQVSTGIPTLVPTTTSMHVYLKAGVQYLLFDQRGNPRHRYSIVLTAHAKRGT